MSDRTSNRKWAVHVAALTALVLGFGTQGLAEHPSRERPRGDTTCFVNPPELPMYGGPTCPPQSMLPIFPWSMLPSTSQSVPSNPGNSGNVTPEDSAAQQAAASDLAKGIQYSQGLDKQWESQQAQQTAARAESRQRLDDRRKAYIDGLSHAGGARPMGNAARDCPFACPRFRLELNCRLLRLRGWR
jgi:hypothetical protein